MSFGFVNYLSLNPCSTELFHPIQGKPMYLVQNLSNTKKDVSLFGLTYAVGIYPANLYNLKLTILQTYLLKLILYINYEYNEFQIR